MDIENQINLNPTKRIYGRDHIFLIDEIMKLEGSKIEMIKSDSKMVNSKWMDIITIVTDKGEFNIWGESFKSSIMLKQEV